MQYSVVQCPEVSLCSSCMVWKLFLTFLKISDHGEFKSNTMRVLCWENSDRLMRVTFSSYLMPFHNDKYEEERGQEKTMQN